MTSQSQSLSLTDALPFVLNTDLLTIEDILVLRELSKDIQAISDEAPVWKGLYDEAVKAGSSYKENARGFFGKEENEAILCTHEFKSLSWSAFPKVDTTHDGLRSCFTPSNTTVTTTVETTVGQYQSKEGSFYQMAKCLRSKTCQVCGKLGNIASPVTFKRYCSQECADKDGCSTPCEPIGVWSDNGTMQHAYKCNHEGSNISGCLEDIAMHERLQHGIVYSHRPNQYHFEVFHHMSEYNPPEDPRDFAQIFEGCTVRKGVKQESYHEEDLIVYCFQNYDIRFKNGCSLAVDVVSSVIQKTGSDTAESLTYALEAFFQPQDDAVPMQLLHSRTFYNLFATETSGSGVTHDKACSSLMNCLGVKSDSKFIELLGMIIKEAVDLLCLEDLSRPFVDKEDCYVEEPKDQRLDTIFNSMFPDGVF
jgi:hypothetical protein